MRATSDNLNILAESSSWYLDGTFKSSPKLFYQILIIHAELPSLTDDRSWCLPTVYILLTNKDSAMYLEAFQSLASNCPTLAPQVMMMDFEQAFRSSLSSTSPSALVDGCHAHGPAGFYGAIPMPFTAASGWATMNRGSSIGSAKVAARAGRSGGGRESCTRR